MYGVELGLDDRNEQLTPCYCRPMPRLIKNNCQHASLSANHDDMFSMLIDLKTVLRVLYHLKRRPHHLTYRVEYHRFDWLRCDSAHGHELVITVSRVHVQVPQELSVEGVDAF
ncbi:hypothetical protein TNCV_4763421 [Trichonephila clavipes]|nr:hypothetical protein TNCV_4763421 [Trichonephila clavipes]